MGCPPDPIDVSISYSKDRIQTLAQKYKSLREGYNHSVKLWKRFPESKLVLQEFGDNSFDSSITSFPSEYDPYADLKQIYTKEEVYKEKVKSLEIFLCNLRCEILNLSKEWPDRLTSEELKSELELHTKHRNEDRAQWISWLCEKKELCIFLLNDNSHADLESQKIKSKIPGLIQKIDSEISRVTKLDEIEILYDRNSFGKNEKVFDTLQLYE